MRFAILIQRSSSSCKLFRGFALAVVFGIATIHAYPRSSAQPTAAIFGYVTDMTGAEIPKAAISLERSDGEPIRTAADERGRFVIEALPGNYILAASSQGFFTHKESIQLRNTTIIKKKIVLYVGFCSPCVTVMDGSGNELTPVVVSHNSASLSGYVQDVTGASIPGAIITLKNNGNIIQEIGSNPAGHFSTEAQLGEYTLEVSSPGFATYKEAIKLKDPASLGKDKFIVLQIASGSLLSCSLPCFWPPSIELLDASLTFTLPLKPLPPFRLRRHAGR